MLVTSLINAAQRKFAGNGGLMLTIVAALLWSCLYPNVVAYPPFLFGVCVTMVIPAGVNPRVFRAVALLLSFYSGAVLVAEYALAIWSTVTNSEDFLFGAASPGIVPYPSTCAHHDPLLCICCALPSLR